MKKFIAQWGLIAGLLFASPTYAQINISVNLSTQPAWGPVGYDYVEYYYIPDIEMYYYVPTRQFIYWRNGNWIWVSELPYHCRHYDLYTGYKVIINGPRPYAYHHKHKVKYAKYKNYHGKQTTIKHGHAKKVQGAKPVKTHAKPGGNPGKKQGGGNKNHSKGKGKH